MEWTKGEVPGTTFGLSESGWIDMKLFKGWLCDHFLKHAVPSRPLLLLLDWHSSHHNPKAVRVAKENDVILFTLVPHTTHEMQPLDTAVFGPLKAHWREACHKYIQNNPGMAVTKYQFSSLLSEAWMNTMSPSTIISGFKSCGIYPFNPKAVLNYDPYDTLVQKDQNQGLEKEPIHNLEQDLDSVQMTTDTDYISPGKNADVFTKEEELRFSRRHDEGYDLYDEHYLAWLSLNYPEEVESLQRSDSVAQFFNDMLPCTPVIIPELELHNESSPSSIVEPNTQN